MAFAVPGPAGSVLSSAVVPQDEGGREPEAVRGALGEKLPEHLVPSRVVFPDSVPRAVAGRADRAALVRLSREAGPRHPSPR
ncbi:hypothetical protein ABT269_02715 [Streptomyces viridosporus]|uniref:hypothetical protein n=1 Tax=Streptomyces viridosporus TaxID=67581 RepID=UPI0033330938